jgi:ParB-like nuclease domain
MKIEINKLNPHPNNRKVYGYDDNIPELAERIRQSNWIKPILITRQNMIISGHRRVEACKALNIVEIEFEYVPDDPITQLELFVGENCYREKTNYQKTQEAKIYAEIEQHKAYNRMIEAGKQNLGQSSAVETFPPLGEGKTRDIVGDKIGMSGRSLDKAQKVVDKMDSTNDEAIREFFEDTLNVNIDAAAKLVEKPDEIIHQVFEKTAGDPKKVSGVIRELDREKMMKPIPLPPGKYQILLLDLTNRVNMIPFNTTISGICEQDCVLFSWVLPHQVATGIEISKNWGFRYASCFVWNRDQEHELSDHGEICLITVKGSPHIIFEHFPYATEKPSLLKKVIDIVYPGWSRVEIFKGDGWEIW